MHSLQNRLIWIVPEQRGGIRSYSDVLWPAVRDELNAGVGKEWEPIAPIYDLENSIDQLMTLKPSLIHVQHEYGLFGSKIPIVYRFPGWLRKVREALPGVRVVATAHTVLDQLYRYPTALRGWQTPFRVIINRFGLPLFRPYWLQKTWGQLDAVVVHSSLQEDAIRASGCPRVEVIPHFVPEIALVTASDVPSVPTVVVFGYISPEKGQDIAIRAMKLMKRPARLILAGGIRRPADHRYYDYCRTLIAEAELTDRVTITGYVSEGDVDKLYAKSDLVLAPFRETSGSGSLPQALARGAAILASDLPLNCELERRELNCLAFFRTGDPADCAKKMEELLSHRAGNELLRQKALKYAAAHSPRLMAKRHVALYRSLFGASG